MAIQVLLITKTDLFQIIESDQIGIHGIKIIFLKMIDISINNMSKYYF